MRKIKYIIVGAFLLFYLWIAYQIPYTHDDWDWGLEEGINQLLTANINARYAGNLLVVLLTRSVVLKTLIMGVSFWVLPILMTKLVADKENTNALPIYLLSNCFPMLLQHWTWVQTYNWVSGFCNYVMSSIMILVHLIFTKELLSKECINKSHTKLQLLGYFVFSVIIQLFLENITVFMVFISSISLWYSIRRKVNVKKYATILIGNLLGMAIMFSSSMYRELIEEGASLEGVREVAISSGAGNIATTISNIFATWTAWLFNHSFKFYLLIFALLLYLSIKYRKNHPGTTNAVFRGSCVAFILFVVPNTAQGVWILALAAITCFGLCLYIENKSLRLRCLLIYLAHFIVIAPLVLFEINNPQRLFITSSLFLMLLIVNLVNNEISHLSKKPYKALLIVLSLVTLCNAYYCGNVYQQIGAAGREYKKNIEEAIETEQTTIQIPINRIYNTYLWEPYPYGYRNEFYKRFYGLPQYVEINLNLEEMIEGRQQKQSPWD